MNAIFKLSAAVIMLLSISACAHRHGYYAPYSDSYYYGSGGSYYGGSSGYYGNDSGHHHHYHKKQDKHHYEYGDRYDHHDRNWGYGNRQPWQGGSQYSRNEYGQAPHYNNSDNGWKEHKRHHAHRGEGWRKHDHNHDDD